MAHSKRSLVITYLAVVVFISSLASLAMGAPTILNYQGTLYKDGKAVTGTKTMVFRIYAKADATTALWSSGNVQVPVTSGVFNVTLGASPQPAFPSTLFSNDTRFLGITVDGEEIERKRLASVPYALNASIPSSAIIPKGVIVMWSGAPDKIPSGWAICDGQNGTPDLRDRFIVGAGGGYAVGSTGGATSNNLAHSHTVNDHVHGIHAESPGTSAVGDHTHSYTGTTSVENRQGKFRKDSDGGTAANDNHTHTYSGTTTPSGAHSHTVDSHSHGGATHGASPGTNSQLSTSVENRPPYYALCFIMKL